jgi:outer membrane protein assembly factor BamB
MRFNSQAGNADEMPEDAPLLEETSLEMPSNTRLARRTRLALTLLSLGLVLVLLVTLAPAWSGAVRQAWSRLFPPPPYQGALVYAQRADGALIALRASDGSTQWVNNQLSGQNVFLASNSMLIADGVASHANGTFAVRASDGHILWSRPNPGGSTQQILIPLSATQGLNWLTVPDGNQMSMFQGINLQDGAVQWSTTVNGMLESIGNIVNDTLMVCLSSPPTQPQQSLQMIMLDMRTGKIGWQTPPLSYAPAKNSAINCDDGPSTEYLEQLQGNTSRITAYQRADGKQQWQRSAPGDVTHMDATSLYLTTYFVYQPSTLPQTLTALNATDGSQRWQIPGQFTNLYFSNAAPANPTVLLMQTPTGIAGIAPQTGTVLWQVQSQRFGIPASQAAYGVGDVVYYLNSNTLSALHTTTGTSLWHMNLPPTSNGFQLAYHDQHVYLADQNGLMAIDPTNGHPSWRVTDIVALVG